MKRITLEEFLDKCLLGPGINQRLGQWCFNVLIECRPDLAEKCRDTSVDPFYNDCRIDIFIYWVKLMWSADLDAVNLVPISLIDLKMRYPL